MDKQSVAHPLKWNTIFCNKTEGTADTLHGVGEPSNVFYQMKETRLKWLDTVLFHLYDSLEKTKYRERQQINSCQELRVEEGSITKGQLKGIWVLELFCTFILVVAQLYAFVKTTVQQKVNFISCKSKIKSFWRKDYKYLISHSLGWQKCTNLTMPIWQFQVRARMTYILLEGMQTVQTLGDNWVATSEIENAHQPMAQQFDLQVSIHFRGVFTHVLEPTCKQSLNIVWNSEKPKTTLQ